MISRLIFSALFVIYSINCATLQQASSAPLEAYVLTNPAGQVIGNSGVRIGPLDLKYENPNRLQKYGLSKELIEKLLPYLGKSGVEALQLIQQRPLKLTQQEYDSLTKNVVDFWKPKLERAPAALKQQPEVQNLFRLAEQQNWPLFWEEATKVIQRFQGKQPTPTV